MTTNDILKLLDIVWARAGDIPCKTETRAAFHKVVVLGGIGGWRPGGLVGLQYRFVEPAFVRDPLHRERFRLAAKITIKQIKQRSHKIKRDQSNT